MNRPTYVEDKNQEANKLDLRSEMQDQYGHKSIPWAEWVFNALDFPENARVLELGSGSARLWQQNRAQIAPGWKIILSDLTPGMLLQARQNLIGQAEQSSGQFRFTSMNAQGLPFADASFDALLAFGVLDLVTDLRQALSEARLVLRPTGQLVVSAGGRGHLHELEDLLSSFMPARQADQMGGDETRFGLENGRKLLSPFFKDVIRLDYRDQMIFTDLEPILEYALSEQVVQQSLNLITLTQFTQALKNELARRGEIRISLHKGILIARQKR